MSTSEFTQKGKRMNDDTEAPPTSKRHESSSSLSNDIRIIPLSSNLAGLSITEPSNYVACIIPKSLISVFEKVLRETVEKGLASQQVITQPQSEDQEIESEILSNEFIHDFETVRETFTKKLYSLSDHELKQEVPRGKFNVFKDYRRRLTKWYVTGHHLRNNLTSPSNTRKFVKLHTSFSPAISNESTKQVVLSKLKKTEDRCEILLTESVIQSAYELNKEALDLFKQADENSDSSLIKILLKAYRSISRKYKYLTRSDNTTNYNDDIRGRGPPHQQRTFYRRRPQYDDRYVRRVSDADSHTERFNRYPRREYDGDEFSEREHRYPRRDYQRYNQEYPQLRNRNTNYRRYKRNPHYDERDYDSDEVFEQDEQPHGRRRWSHRD
jgi:hypothetical protein